MLYFYTEKRKQNILYKHLFIYAFLFDFITTQFVDFAFQILVFSICKVI